MQNLQNYLKADDKINDQEYFHNYQSKQVDNITKVYEVPEFYKMPISLENYDHFNSVVGTAPLDGDSPTYNRVIDTQTNKTYSVVSSTYTPINNALFYGNLERAISSVYSGIVDKTPFVYGSNDHRGVRSAMRYRLTDLSYNIKQGTRRDFTHPTKIIPELWAYNSYDGSQTARASFSLFDIVCENGMATKQLIDLIKVKHTKNASLAINPERIQNGINLAKKQVGVIQQWANESINYAQAKELLLTLKGMVDNKTPDKLENSKRDPADITLDHLLNNFESESVKRGGRTVWSLVSAVTDWSTLRSRNDNNKLHTSSLSAGVNRQERVANWISNHVMPTYSHLGAVA